MPQTRKLRDGSSKPRGKAGTGKPRGKAGAGRSKRGSKANRQITPPRFQGMEGGFFVGLDVHRDTIQMCVMDVEGNVQYNEKMDNTPAKIRYYLGNIPGSGQNL